MKRALLAVLLASAGLAAQGVLSQNYDLIIRHGHIIDGTGSPWYAADVAIRDGNIAAIGNLERAAAKHTIDAHGMVVAPGFIDMLGQSETTMLVDPHLPSKIYQGITTEITGEGGIDCAAHRCLRAADRVGYEHYGIKPDWRTFRRIFRAAARNRAWASTWRATSGATQVRRVVIGDDDRAPTAEELSG